MPKLSNVYLLVGISLFNIAALVGGYFAVSFLATFFSYEPTSGDLTAIYLPATAFGYTFQIVSMGCVMLFMNWFTFKVFKQVRWHALVELRFMYSYAIMALCAGVFANKFDWWVRLVFGNDQYGYYTTRPTTAAMVSGIACAAILYVSVSQNYGKKSGFWVSLACLTITTFLSYLAAYSVYINL